MLIGFDFDGTLTNPTFGNFLQSISKQLNSSELILITSRSKIDEEVRERVKELDLNISQYFAIGGEKYTHKVDFVIAAGIKLDMFFDNDPYDAEAFRSLGILCLFIPPEPDSLMEEIYEGFLADKCRDLNSSGLNDIIGMVDGGD